MANIREENPQKLW